MSDGPILRINGTPYIGWTTLQVNNSLDVLCGSFSAQISDRLTAEGGDAAVERWPIKRGAECTVETASGEVLLTAFVETIAPTYDDKQHQLSVSGRSITCDLVDCSYAGTKREWIDETVFKIIKDLCAPFDITVKPIGHSAAMQAMDMGKKIRRFKVNEGENIAHLIQRAARMRALRPVDLGDGIVSLIHSSDQLSTDSIESGVNIKQARAVGSDRDRYSEYVVKGTALDSDDHDEGDEEEYTAPEGRWKDEAMSRPRVLVIHSNGVATNAECEEQAKWEAAVRAGASREFEFLTGGWEQSNGEAWKLNKLTLVTDPFMGLDDVLLTSSLGFRFGLNGSETRISICPPEKYELLDVGDNLVYVTDQFDEESGDEE